MNPNHLVLLPKKIFEGFSAPGGSLSTPFSGKKAMTSSLHNSVRPYYGVLDVARWGFQEKLEECDNCSTTPFRLETSS